jgi:glycosyltransferase involved in cell wall biosynthesis
LEKLPKISVITITFNAEALIEKTIQSVVNQDYENIEYIIIDGASTDSTLSIANKYKSQISKIISEPDRGLYDAMNKGITHSTGDFLIFMNAGDSFYSRNVISKIYQIDNGESDIYYGETMCLNENFQEIGLRSVFTPHKLPEKLNWKSMRFGMVVCHQSIFIRKNIAPFYKLEHRYCADIDWIIESLKKTNKVINLYTIVSFYLKGGLSDKKHKESLTDRFNVMKNHFGLFPTIFAHIWIIMRAFFRKLS